jgi:hypothetical protein
MSEPSVRELEERLNAARLRESERILEVRKAHPVQYKFTITVDKRRSSFDRMYDTSIKRYAIRRFVTNRAESEALGHPEWEMRDGGMTYLFNTHTNLIICSCGGGTSYISPAWNQSDDDYDAEAFREISRFLVVNPQGGDITHIVNKFLEKRRASKG